MSLTIGYEPLLDYSDHERRKWRAWVEADPGRLDLTVQPGGRFPTIATLLEHIYFVERRHLSRLEGGTPPDTTGIAGGDWPRLFEYADLVRADLRTYVADIDDQAADATIGFVGMDGRPYSMSKRRLLTHIVLHEVRHLAQIALAARLRGIEPPGEHDIFFAPET
jgi:uncharacterized damage-inducible protein DinB